MADMNEAYTVLSALLPGKVSLPGSNIYELSQSTYFSAQAAEHFPACIVSPTSSADVAVTIKAISQLDLKFAVRGGGLTLNSGAANISDGIVINLRSMNSVIVSEDKTFVSIGGGAKWGEVYPHLDALGLATSGGRVSAVGVGGLSLGGGISYFSAREGLVCDNIIGYEIVLSSGAIIHANQTSHSDLWRALKGGSSNFGIVTRFDIRTFPQGPFYGGVVSSPISTLDAQLRGFVELLEDFDPYAAIIMSMRWNKDSDSFSIFCNLEYTKEESDPACFRPFTQVQPQFLNTMRISTLSKKLSDFDAEAGKYVKSGLRNQFATTTFAGNLPILKEVYSIWKASIPSIAHIPGINWSISVQPFPPAFSNKTASLGGNVLGLNPADGPLILLLLSYNWSSRDDDKDVETAARKLIADIDKKTKEMGVWNRFKYLNYAAAWQEQDVFEGYGEENLAFLRDVGERYDKVGLWRERCPGGFKVFR